jgi:unsaturated chondroitin disaccharide hydrolase
MDMQTTTTQFPLETATDAIVSRTQQTAARASHGFPHYADMQTGEWTYSPDGDWTGGFFVGQLWLAAASGLGDHDAAARWAEKLRPRISSDTVFRGFLFWYGAALGARLCEHGQSQEIALRGARALAESFHPRARLLPLGSAAEEAHSVGPAETNIDGVPGGAPLLYWAAALTGDDSLREIARSHVARHVEFLVRADGSTVQSGTFDQNTGELIKTYTHKGVTDDSTWARAQAWAMLGLAQAARHDPDLFATDATRVCDWWCSHLPSGHIAYWDFDAPDHEPQPLLDTSATSIAAAALLKMRTINPGRAEEYERTACDMITALADRHVSRPLDPVRPAGIVGDACYNNRIGLATRSELVWGTYFLLESLLTLTGRLDASDI